MEQEKPGWRCGACCGWSSSALARWVSWLRPSSWGALRAAERAMRIEMNECRSTNDVVEQNEPTGVGEDCMLQRVHTSVPSKARKENLFLFL